MATKSRSKTLSPEDLIKSLKSAANSPADKPDVLKALEDAGIPSPIILVGTQQVRIRRTIDWLRDSFFSGNQSAVSSYFGQDLQSSTSVKGIINAITSPSLFSPTQFSVVYEADKIKAAAAKPLVEALSIKNSSCLLALTCEKFNSRHHFFAKLPKQRSIVEFKDLSPAKLKKWIAKEVSLSGNQAGIESSAADILIQCYGSDVTALSREILKLCLLCAPGQRIEAKDVESLSMRSPEVTSFELLQQIAKKNPAATTSLVGDLVDQGFHPLQLSSFLSRCIRTLLANHGRAAANEEDSGIAAELSNAWFIRNLGAANRMFSKTELRESLELLKELDAKLKDSGLPAELNLNIAVQRMTARSFLPRDRA